MLWLASWVGKITISVPQENSVFFLYTINTSLTRLFQTRWLDIGPFCIFYRSHIIIFFLNAWTSKKELGQYLAILTSSSVNNPYILTTFICFWFTYNATCILPSNSFCLNSVKFSKCRLNMRGNKPFGEVQWKIFQFYLLEIKKLRTSLTASKRIIDKDRNTKTTERINNNSLSCSVTDLQYLYCANLKNSQQGNIRTWNN